MLRQQPDLPEVNFWAPMAAQFQALRPGEIFLFKRHAPRNVNPHDRYRTQVVNGLRFKRGGGAAGGSMYLKNVGLKNFRSFDSGEVYLQKDLTIFVGENNGGKSNTVDAIRLLTLPIGGRRELYCEPSDARFQSMSKRFDLTATYAGLSAAQQGRFISAATDTSLTEARIGLAYDGARTLSRPVFWASREGSAPEPGCLDWVRHLYLPPLRDAKRALASGNPTRIMALLTHFLDGTSEQQLAQDLARTKTHTVLSKIDAAVGDGLTALTGGVRRQAASLGFASDEKLIEIARDLRFKLADQGVEPEDLRYSGHGYANLLFMAIIAVELEKVRTHDLTLFLVEEPEAHLHPQLQAAVLSFLRDQADHSRSHEPIDRGPAGELQVIVASHSPNLSAWVDSHHLVVFKSAHPASNSKPTNAAPLDPAAADAAVIEGGTGQDSSTSTDGEAEALATTVVAAALRRSTRCVALARMPLDPVERKKVDRYLDVTKSALLFGGRVLLIEGIAEALLIPVIAKKHTLFGHEEKLRLFRSATFVPIDGVDFMPYAKLLLTAVDDARVADRVVVVTDGDKDTDDDEDEDGDDTTESAAAIPSAAEQPEPPAAEKMSKLPGERRKRELEAIAESLGASNFLRVITSTYSLEAELLEPGNEAIMRAAFLAVRPRSSKAWDKAVVLKGDERAAKIHQLFKRTRKGDFAQVLARLIEAGDPNTPFTVPAYIEQAINEVVAPL